MELYEKLAKGPDSAAALESVLKEPDQVSAMILYFAASAALKENRLEDSGFLFYAAQLRARFDKECFPPKGQGGDSPFLVYGILSQQLGSIINPKVMAEPQVLEKALDRVKGWNPKASDNYHPGYNFTERKSDKAAHDAAKAGRTEFMDRMTGLCTLLKDADYFAAFRVVQDYNMAPDNSRPSEVANSKATQTMKRIEEQKGIKGYLSK